MGNFCVKKYQCGYVCVKIFLQSTIILIAFNYVVRVLKKFCVFNFLFLTTEISLIAVSFALSRLCHISYGCEPFSSEPLSNTG